MKIENVYLNFLKKTVRNDKKKFWLDGKRDFVLIILKTIDLLKFDLTFWNSLIRNLKIIKKAPKTLDVM